MRFQIVTPALGPFAAAVAAQIKRDDAATGLNQRIGHDAPFRAGLPGTVDQQDGRIVFIADRIRFKPHTAEALEGKDGHSESPDWGRPCQIGGRFSAKARGPSRASSLLRQAAKAG